MIPVDLITGFLGSGKTTFIKKYASYLLRQGSKIGILENDYGAVNVDMMLLGGLEDDNCIIEMVAGACCSDCHRRRFKTKLIALAMSGCDRVLIEPSGIFDVDEYFDVLCESPLDRMCRPGSVITVVDARLEDELSASAEYMLASQTATAGAVVFSKTQLADENDVQNTMEHLNLALEKLNCPRRLTDGDVLAKDWSELNDDDFERLMNCGRRSESFVKQMNSDETSFKTLYFMNTALGKDNLRSIAETLMNSESFGKVLRVKGFVNDGGWYELNATGSSFSLRPTDRGQDIIIVIGEDLHEEEIGAVLRRRESVKREETT